MMYMVGAAIAQAIIQEVIQVPSKLSPGPIARQVAMPDTRNVMKKEVPAGRAKRWRLAGNFFTLGGTIWYGLPRRPSSERNSAHAHQPAVPDRQATRLGCPEEEDRLPGAARSLPEARR